MYIFFLNTVCYLDKPNQATSIQYAMTMIASSCSVVYDNKFSGISKLNANQTSTVNLFL